MTGLQRAEETKIRTVPSQFEQAVVPAGWAVRQNLVWVKVVMVLGNSDYHWRHEPILYGFTSLCAC